MTRLLAAVAAALLALSGCSDPEKDPVPIEGSTYRISSSKAVEGSELNLRILRDRRECGSVLGLQGEELEACLPVVDRARGETTLSFTLQDSISGRQLYLPLMADQVQASHMGSPITAPGDYELIQRNPMRSGQLFILLIDGSGSMYENDGDRIKKVYRALLNKSVIEGFFPKDKSARTGVVLLRFSSQVTGLDGNAPVVLTNRRQYEAMVKNYLMNRVGGFTHLYDAVQYSVTKLMDERAIADWLLVNTAEPTIVALTDGFNNEKGADLCGDNAPRLERTLGVVLEARQVGAAGSRPTLYTVGLGAPINKGWRPKKGEMGVSAGALCGKHKNRMINADLEKYGIDNVSLAWMADVGGGASFVKRNHRGLAEVFQAAAAERYEWYTLRYRVDGFYHRQAYETRISLLAYAFAGSEVELHPSGWMDAPSGEVGEGKWAEPSPLRRSGALFIQILGALILLAFVGPATFNARRAIFRRAKKR